MDTTVDTTLSSSRLPRSGTVLVVTILYLLEHWPEGYGANTPKEVLLIHEVHRSTSKYIPCKYGEDRTACS